MHTYAARVLLVALIALAFVVLYKDTEVLNFALGEFFLLSAFSHLVLRRWHESAVSREG